jgi:hypothetical protein
MSSKSRKNTMIGGPVGLAGTRREPSAPESRVRKNHRGGILITPEEIKLAFDFLDCDKSGKVSLANLKKRLAVFFPEMSAKEYRFMMNNKREMTLQDFNDMLLDNEVTNFDPVSEAFKVRNPTPPTYSLLLPCVFLTCDRPTMSPGKGESLQRSSVRCLLRTAMGSCQTMKLM